MIDGKSVLAIIPARGGSKGIPRKNIRNLHGKPLIAWTIEEAQKSKYIDRLILSSEDNEIIHIAKQWGCEVPFVRPKELAQDDTPGIAPILHAIDTLKEAFDFVVLLQVTSPLRTVDDIDGCIDWCVKQQADSCIAVSEVIDNPYWMFTLEQGNKLTKLIETDTNYLRRQDLPTVYIVNGAMYVSRIEWLQVSKSLYTSETIGYVMPPERAIDIDCELDFSICELIQKLNERAINKEEN